MTKAVCFWIGHQGGETEVRGSRRRYDKPTVVNDGLGLYEWDVRIDCARCGTHAIQKRRDHSVGPLAGWIIAAVAVMIFISAIVLEFLL
jgi:hypothetical protein